MGFWFPGLVTSSRACGGILVPGSVPGFGSPVCGGFLAPRSVAGFWLPGLWRVFGSRSVAGCWFPSLWQVFGSGFVWRVFGSQVCGGFLVSGFVWRVFGSWICVAGFSVTVIGVKKLQIALRAVSAADMGPRAFGP